MLQSREHFRLCLDAKKGCELLIELIKCGEGSEESPVRRKSTSKTHDIAFFCLRHKIIKEGLLNDVRSFF